MLPGSFRDWTGTEFGQIAGSDLEQRSTATLAPKEGGQDARSNPIAPASKINKLTYHGVGFFLFSGQSPDCAKMTLMQWPGQPVFRSFRFRLYPWRFRFVPGDRFSG
jgi:hypothetical protein